MIPNGKSHSISWTFSGNVYAMLPNRDTVPSDSQFLKSHMRSTHMILPTIGFILETGFSRSAKSRIHKDKKSSIPNHISVSTKPSFGKTTIETKFKSKASTSNLSPLFRLLWVHKNKGMKENHAKHAEASKFIEECHTILGS